MHFYGAEDEFCNPKNTENYPGNIPNVFIKQVIVKKGGIKGV